MSDPQPKRHAPPDGYANWLDYYMERNEYGRAELAELRADRDSLRQDLADAERERDEAEEKATRFLSERFTAKANLRNLQSVYRDSEKECDELRAKLDEINSLEHVTAKGPIDMLMNRAHQLKLNAALAQVAELRAAILGVGELTGTEVHVGWGATLRVHISHDNAQAFNAVVSRLRAEAKETKQ